MMKHLVLGALALSLAGCAGESCKTCDKEAGEVHVTADQLPPAVKATLDKAAKGGTIKGIDKEMQKGKTVYDADVIFSGKVYEVLIAEDGTLISKKLDEEEEDEKR